MQNRRENAQDSSHSWFQHMNLRLNLVRMNKTMKNLKQHELSLELAPHEYRPSTLPVNQHARPKISRLFNLPIYTDYLGCNSDSKVGHHCFSARKSVMHMTHTWRITIPWSTFLVDTENLGEQQEKSIPKLVNNWFMKFAYCTACKHLHYNQSQHPNWWLTSYLATLKYETPFYHSPCKVYIHPIFVTSCWNWQIPMLLETITRELC